MCRIRLSPMSDGLQKGAGLCRHLADGNRHGGEHRHPPGHVFRRPNLFLERQHLQQDRLGLATGEHRRHVRRGRERGAESRLHNKYVHERLFEHTTLSTHVPQRKRPETVLRRVGCVFRLRTTFEISFSNDDSYFFSENLAVSDILYMFALLTDYTFTNKTIKR